VSVQKITMVTSAGEISV